MVARTTCFVAAVVIVVSGSCAASQPNIRGQREADPKAAKNNAPVAQPPISVTVTAPPKSAEDAKRDAEQREREIAAQESVSTFTAALTLLAFLQAAITFVALLIAIRAANAAKDGAAAARDSVAKMDEVAKAQNTDMRDSIAEATRAATAMEGISQSLITNVGLLRAALDTNERLANTTERAFHIGQRAWLSIVDFRLIDFEPGRYPNLRLHITNVGHMPAAITMWTNCFLTDTPIPPHDPAEAEWVPQSAVVFPNHPIALETSLGEDRGLSPEEFEHIRTGVMTLAIYGAIRYEAGFGIVGETGFGLNYDPTARHFEPHRRFAGTSIPGYNYAR